MIDEAFLKPETRCDYFIDAKMKRIWMRELEILEQIVRICEKFDIKYFLMGGSLLGAMRHKGFIPWDDDIDLAMLRKDYERFQAIAAQELKPPFFFQSNMTDPYYRLGFAKVRNSNTAAIYDDEARAHTLANCGLFVDIFPIDGVPDDKLKMLRLKLRGKLLRILDRRYVVYNRHSYSDRFWHWLGHFVGKVFGDERVAKFRDRTYSAGNINKCHRCGLVSWGLSQKAFFWDSSIFKDERVMKVPFEHLMLPVPVAYDECLTTSYGDWHKMVKGGSWHNAVHMDADRGYRDVLIEEYGYHESDWRQ